MYALEGDATTRLGVSAVLSAYFAWVELQEQGKQNVLSALRPAADNRNDLTQPQEE